MTAPRIVIPAEDLFGGAKSSPPSLPDFDLPDLLEIGVTIVETSESLTAEFPIAAQKKLIASLSNFGFGSSKALAVMLQNALRVIGFDGPVQQTVSPSTLTWTAFQKKEKAV